MSETILDTEQILQEIRDLAREKLDLEGALDPTMRLVEDLQLDSIRILTLAVEVEDHFHICLDQEDEWGIETVADLVATVERKLAS
jgi:acyl carrier protein